MRESHCDPITIADGDNVIVTDGAAGLRDIGNTALMGALDVVAEGEKGVGPKRDAGGGCQPVLFFFAGKNRRFFRKNALPGAVREDIVIFVAQVYVDRVVAVRASHGVLKRQAKRRGTLPQIPAISFISGEAGAMDARLLSRADTDRLSVLRVANGIRLGVF